MNGWQFLDGHINAILGAALLALLLRDLTKLARTPSAPPERPVAALNRPGPPSGPSGLSAGGRGQS